MVCQCPSDCYSLLWRAVILHAGRPVARRTKQRLIVCLAPNAGTGRSQAAARELKGRCFVPAPRSNEFMSFLIELNGLSLLFYVAIERATHSLRAIRLHRRRRVRSTSRSHAGSQASAGGLDAGARSQGKESSAGLGTGAAPARRRRERPPRPSEQSLMREAVCVSWCASVAKLTPASAPIHSNAGLQISKPPFWLVCICDGAMHSPTNRMGAERRVCLFHLPMQSK